MTSELPCWLFLKRYIRILTLRYKTVALYIHITYYCFKWYNDIQYSIATLYMLCTVSCSKAIEPVVVSPLEIHPPPSNTVTRVPNFAVCSLMMVREYYCPIKIKFIIVFNYKVSLIRENKFRIKSSDQKIHPTNYNYELCACLQSVQVSITFIRMVYTPLILLK